MALKSDEDIRNYFIQYLFDLATDGIAIQYERNRCTRIRAKTNSKINYRFTIVANSKGSMIIELLDIDCPTKIEGLIELDWKVGDFKGLRHHLSNKSLIQKDGDGFLYKTFIPTLNIEIT